MDDAQRGSQVSFAHAEMGYPVMQALIARGVIGDFRAPDILRFGFTPLYVRYVDAWDAALHLQQVIESQEWRRSEFMQRQAVT
jgi:kynureninase